MFLLIIILKNNYIIIDGHVSTDHKVSYTKRMAEAHLRSAGLGEYTPKQSGTE